MQEVQALDRRRVDEELRAVRVRSVVRHRKDPCRIVAEGGGELVRKRVAGPALACAERVAALDDKARDDAVEREPVEERLSRRGAEGALREADKVHGREGSPREIKLADDRAPWRGDLGVEAVRKAGLLRKRSQGQQQRRGCEAPQLRNEQMYWQSPLSTSMRKPLFPGTLKWDPAAWTLTSAAPPIV